MSKKDISWEIIVESNLCNLKAAAEDAFSTAFVLYK